ncbi:MAG: M12 family metallo-peptidase [Planctomycetota bacterium]|jgi:hypothetical protein|nr:M12 family metallo-peptidase [Planctomycetota bacterium]
MIISTAVLAALLQLAPAAGASTPIQSPAKVTRAPSLWVPTPARITIELGEDPTITAHRTVALEGALLTRDGEVPVARRLSLALPDGTVVEAELDQASGLPSGADLWSGHLRGRADAPVTFVRFGDAVAGTVRRGTELFRVRYGGPGTHVISAHQEDNFPTCGTGSAHARPASGEHSATAPPPNAPGAPGAPGAGAQDTADVLVVYSPQARSAQGGHNAVKALIELAVAETNQAYENSGADLRLRLVHMVQTDDEDSTFSNNLSDLRGQNDGRYDEVHALREQYGADLVALIVRDTDYCGQAYLMTNVSHSFRNWAFSVTSHICATGYYTFGHELGHNMGCAHDRDNASSGAYAYSFGYRTPNNYFRTVLAYSPGSRIPYFSTPDRSFQGYPLGIAHPDQDSAHNTRGLNTAADTISGWRCAVPETYGDPMVTSGFDQFVLDYTGTAEENGSGNLELQASGGLAGQISIFFYGVAATDTPLLGGTLLVSSPQRGALRSLNAQGQSSWRILDDLPVSAGQSWFVQVFARDPSNPAGFGAVLSNALRIDICD